MYCIEECLSKYRHTVLKEVRKFAFLLFFLGSAATLFAQSISVTGTVLDEFGDEVIGANVVVKGTTTGTMTDLDGKYQLDVPGSESILVFSYLGYTTQEIAVGNQRVINVTLSEAYNDLAEVVVVGYGSVQVKDLTSSITTLKTDDIMKTPAGQPMQALQGKVAGLQVVSAGSPGDSPKIRVRGIGSYPGNDNEAPLYVVDGVFFDNIDFLNMADITSISVLKDASAAAIYGVRAANGVVLIETRSGGYDKKTEITYDGYYGFQRAQNVLKMANAEQFTNMALESGSAADASFIQNAMQRYGRSRKNPNVPDVNTDWYKEILRTAAIQNHSLDISGGTSKASYSVGTSYFAQEGILDMKNEFDRFNLRAKVDIKATDWLTVGGNFIWSKGKKYGATQAAWNEAYFAVPILPVYDENSLQAAPENYANAQDLGYRSGQNPLPTMRYSNLRTNTNKLLANFYAQINFIPNKLTFKTSYSNAYSNVEERNVYLPYYLGNSFRRADAEITRKIANYSDQTWDNILTWTETFDKHNLTVMGGTSFRDESYIWLQAKGLNFPLGQEQSWYIDQAETIDIDNTKDDGLRQYGLSYFGRVSYNYDNRYLLYATMRADGSSKYQQTWGYFPTVGAGWVMSQESFMQDIEQIDFLKLRASWGKLGNDKIRASDGAMTTTTITTAINDVLVTGNYTSGVYSDLKWELTEETNVGLTGQFFDGRLNTEMDYYIRDTKNAAIDVKIPAVGGTVLKNVGVIRNSGFEMSLDWSDRINSDWRYSIGGNIATLRNRVRDLYGQPYIDGGSPEFRQRSIVGEPLLSFYEYEVLGVYQNQAEIDADPIAIANGLVPGDFRYRDVNGDGAIDDDDRVVLGSYFPTFMYGGNISVSYKDFDLNISLMGQTGAKILNRKRGEVIWTADGNMDADLAVNRWHGEGASNKYPSAAGLRKGWNQKMSDYFVESGAFFRIQNIQLAYNIRNQVWFGVKMPAMRVNLTADRPLTVFKYNGFSPEVENGIDTQAYPVPAVYTIGLNIRF